MFKKARVHSNSAAFDETVEDGFITDEKNKWGLELRKFLLDKYCLEGLSGSDVATLSYYITQAGGAGVSDLALRPEVATKHGNEHVKLHAGKIWPDLDLAYVDCPMFVKRESRRSVEQVPIYLPSTAFNQFLTEEMLNFSTHDSRAAFEKIVGGLDNYDNHPVVAGARAENFQWPVRPVALYWDGVSYTNHDSFMGFYVTDILSGQKFLSFLVRSDDMCKCGCRGWDTLYPLLLAWVKDLKYLEAGSKLRCAVLDIQGDWPAFLQIFGMRYWSHKTHPCPLCRISQSEIQQLNLDAITLDSIPYTAYSSNDYLNDVDQSVKVVEITSGLVQKQIFRLLVCKENRRGRVLSKPCACLGLPQWARLMPTPTMPDVASFEFLTVPFKASFWVSPLDFRLTHDCPLMELKGVGLEMWSLDLMHGWHLGPLQLLVSLSLNFCIDSGLWAPDTGLDAADSRKISLLAIKAELFNFYKIKRSDPDWVGKSSEVWNLTLGMLGSEDHPSLGAKAAESHGLLEFVHWLFGIHLERFDKLTPEKKRKGKFLLEAAKAAMGLDDVFQAEHRKMTRSQVQKAFNSYVRFLSFYAKAGGNITPKCHFMLHLIQRSLFKGNPRLYTTYRDESFNGLLAKIARSCHRRTWMNAIHWKCRELHSKHHQKVIKPNAFDKNRR
ncbi:unnamed protein product [Cladocopium goreaui]|uniref:Uncharacterized protein n=1 Tax=Cladocopium goreaui TaxID=2562237 RepID=A0A9P1C1V4_9DINO|nr:unnamed protein product [Cladocopium goreaui]